MPIYVFSKYLIRFNIRLLLQLEVLWRGLRVLSVWRYSSNLLKLNVGHLGDLLPTTQDFFQRLQLPAIVVQLCFQLFIFPRPDQSRERGRVSYTTRGVTIE